MKEKAKEKEKASELTDAFADIAISVGKRSNSNYVVGICSPLEGPGRSLSIHATYGDLTGSLTAQYDATGFDLTGCDPAYVADPCGSMNCGVVEGIVCAQCADGLNCVEDICQE